MTEVQAVMDTLQRVYGDATQTTLDHRAASEVIKTLRGLGWASLQDVAAIIASAGGEVRLSPDHMLTDWEVLRTDELPGPRLIARPARKQESA